MKALTFIDTLFVVALINRQDQHHACATELAAGLEGHPFLTTDAVIIEIGNALARRHKRQAIEIIDHLKASPDVQVVHTAPEVFERAADLYRTHRDKEWGLTDCISFVVMRDAGVIDALTFDRHFQQAGFRALMRDDPAGN